MGAMCALIRPAFRVLVDLDQTKSVPQNELRGILDFARESSRWSTWIPGRGVGGATSPDPERMGADGVIAGWRTDAALLRRAFRRGIPVVSFAAPRRSRAFAATVSCDNASIARLAAEHLVSRGFRNFAFVGEENGIRWSRERLDGFRSELAARGFPCAVCPMLSPPQRADRTRARRELASWLGTLPLPVAVFAAYDVRARQVLEACAESGLSVPSDVAVLGVDNDPLLCETCDPPLSSVVLDAEEAGFAAAAALDEAMRGNRAPWGMIRFGGVRVIERASTARFVGRDRLVAQTRSLVSSGLSGRLPVSGLARTLGVSRRTLESRFRAETGVPLGRAILLERIALAKHLLGTTAMTHEAIADACGFCDASHMGRAFRRLAGAKPSDFRKSGTNETAGKPDCRAWFLPSGVNAGVADYQNTQTTWKTQFIDGMDGD